MAMYILKLAIILPLVCGLAWGSLMLWKRLQRGLPAMGPGARAVRIVDAVSMGTSGRLIVVAFGGRNLLVSATRGQIALIAEAASESADA